MEYREIAAGDISELVKIFTETFNSEPWFEKWTEKTAEKRLSHYLNNESCVGIVSAEGEEITGMLIGEEEQYYDGVVCVIKEFCVKNALRGRGIGSSLINEFEKREIARGVRSITFYTTEEDEGFYAKNGYSKSDGMIFMGKEL